MRTAVSGLFLWVLVLTVVACMGASGCMSLSGDATRLLGTATPPPPSAPSPGSVVVEVRAGKKPHVVEIPYQPEMHVQDAVRESGALKKMRRMHVVVMRSGPDGQRQKLESQFDPVKAKVPPAFDYALYPGDYIILSRDHTSALDNMFERTVGPVGRIFRNEP